MTHFSRKEVYDCIYSIFEMDVFKFEKRPAYCSGNNFH